MDLRDQLQDLFPDHEPEGTSQESADEPKLWLQDTPILCKFEKRKGKPVTIIEGYTGAAEDFKKLTRILKNNLRVGGSFKNERIIIQGNNRDKIMLILEELGFNTKRVGG
ncbi:MAG: translation initiation factor [Eudoraea sp.]|nr:translation initiation factor [Eudoraea sp.]